MVVGAWSMAEALRQLFEYFYYYNVEYRDGIKSKGDKIGMPCTDSTVIQDTRNSQPKRINDTSPILSQRHTAVGVVHM